ncbi:hypothetical protein CEUSTIGMA_g3762.t1 [Chlamydomonas eustigma]|uniref:JmjC domain-containing protein n=1 Tax=Chlamydomonas eustigma TaxID=1157962 RepID=A0A250WZV7_9CHLO|nr:hypothetical protein CEUSTIGMA_g3762.t1 [Chlamydomonas eustigma]|eukprot:GAX76316.1 hypothetical protein CEUSTIGMA_g3762.t1 [Chlamydomonas eustigma]
MKTAQILDEYSGYKCSGGSIDVVEAHELDAYTFWHRYISQRKPVLIKGHLSDASWKATAKWTDSYLLSEAGHCNVKVEKRNSPDESFGKGTKIPMKFREFLKYMSKGDDTLYLSTQDVEAGPDGFPELMGHPLLELQKDLVKVPELMGNLVPQQINLWMGASSSSSPSLKSGSSSGLHHDFHDNLYVLIRGRKRFRLFDPSKAPLMYTHGKIRRIHQNGRIVYDGQGEVLTDGSEQRDVKLWSNRVAAEEEVAAAEAAVTRHEQGSETRLKNAEEQLEAVLEMQLDAALLEDSGAEDEEDDEISERFGGKAEPRSNSTGVTKRGAKNDHPPSFSKVDLSLSEGVLRKRFPSFPGASQALECIIEAGQMLYLPAGWFHEVTSSAVHYVSNIDCHAGGHMAVNYWFYPPDNLDASNKGFFRPYVRDYLPSMWRDRYPEEQSAGHVHGSHSTEPPARVNAQTTSVAGVAGQKLHLKSSARHGSSLTHLTPVPGSKGGLKRRCIGRSKSGTLLKMKRSVKEAEESIEDDPDYEPGEEEAMTADDVYHAMTKDQQEKIMELIQRAMQSGYQIGGNEKQKQKTFTPPRGRRHHSVIFCPKKSQK